MVVFFCLTEFPLSPPPFSLSPLLSVPYPAYSSFPTAPRLLSTSRFPRLDTAQLYLLPVFNATTQPPSVPFSYPIHPNLIRPLLSYPFSQLSYPTSTYPAYSDITSSLPVGPHRPAAFHKSNHLGTRQQQENLVKRTPSVQRLFLWIDHCSRLSLSA